MGTKETEKELDRDKKRKKEKKLQQIDMFGNNDSVESYKSTILLEGFFPNFLRFFCHKFFQGLRRLNLTLATKKKSYR